MDTSIKKFAQITIGANPASTHALAVRLAPNGQSYIYPATDGNFAYLPVGRQACLAACLTPACRQTG
jgi:hypothetical protein